MTEGNASGGELHQKIIETICEEWPTPDGYLQSATIYERLTSENVEVTEDALSNALSELANRGQITLTGVGDTPDQARAHDGITIYGVRDDLCEEDPALSG